MSSPLKIEWSQCAENTITPQVWGLWTAYSLTANEISTLVLVYSSAMHVLAKNSAPNNVPKINFFIFYL